MKRNAELVAMLEVASHKIDRFGWGNMDTDLKDSLCSDWCGVLSKYVLAEVKQGIRNFFAENAGKARSINEHQVEHQIKLLHKRAVAGLPHAPKADSQPPMESLNIKPVNPARKIEAEAILRAADRALDKNAEGGEQ